MGGDHRIWEHVLAEAEYLHGIQCQSRHTRNSGSAKDIYIKRVKIMKGFIGWEARRDQKNTKGDKDARTSLQLFFIRMARSHGWASASSSRRVMRVSLSTADQESGIAGCDGPVMPLRPRSAGADTTLEEGDDMRIVPEISV